MSERTRPWILEDEEEILATPVFTLHRRSRRSAVTPTRRGDFYVMECPDWVNVIAMTDRDEVVLVEQYRQGSDTVTLELPGGMMDPGESPLAAARRELQEETGYIGGEGALIGATHPNPALQANRCHTALLWGVKATGLQNLDPNEEIVVRRVALDLIPALISDGVITHALVVSAFYYLSTLSDR